METKIILILLCGVQKPHLELGFTGSSAGKDPLEKGTASHSSILAWRIPWTGPWGCKELDMMEWLSLHFTSLHFSYNWSPDMPVGGALTPSHAPSIIPNRKKLTAFISSLQQNIVAYFTIQKEEENFSPPNHSPANPRVYQCNLWEASILWTSSFRMWLLGYYSPSQLTSFLYKSKFLILVLICPIVQISRIAISLGYSWRNWLLLVK